ncbi:MAG: right-handed parallel beta-helix repeat-containing protein [Polyangiaceae bacterium]
MRSRSTLLPLSVASVLSLSSLLVLAPGCASAPEGDDAHVGESSDALMGDQARILQTIGPDAVVDGRFDPRVRVLGYVVEAKAGATVAVTLDARPGTDAIGTTSLDLVMAIYPYATTGLGPAITTSSNGQVLSTTPLRFTAPTDGKFLVAFSSWNDTGTGTYRLKTECAGTDFQCRRPRATTPCTPGTTFVRGNSIPTDTTWDQCEVVLLEPLVVPAGVTLTVRPGVVVKGNYLGTGDFGTVNLRVDGTLQAAGTPDAPIAFTSYVANKGWGGLALYGKNNTLSDAYVERASVGITLGTGSSATIQDTIVQGLPGGASLFGILALNASEVNVSRSVVKKFQIGIQVSDVPVFNLKDSVVRENSQHGVVAGNANGSQSCGGSSATVFRDPTITNSEIRKNGRAGIYVGSPNVHLVVSQSLITENAGPAISIETTGLQPTSYLRDNNILGNAQPQVVSWHRNGSLDISSNYWNAISDPALSANWSFPCGSSSAFTFTRFSPTPIPNVGPDFPNLREAVRLAAANP